MPLVINETTQHHIAFPSVFNSSKLSSLLLVYSSFPNRHVTSSREAESAMRQKPFVLFVEQSIESEYIHAELAEIIANHEYEMSISNHLLSRSLSQLL